MSIPGNRNPYGRVPAVGLVLGTKLGQGRARALIELQEQAILSDFGVREYGVSAYFPLRVGLSLQTGS